MLEDFNVDLEQQPRATPLWDVLDLMIMQANQLEVDKMNGEAHECEPELVKVCKKAWAATPDVKILQAFEMRKNCATEALETEGRCPNEGKGRGGAKRVYLSEGKRAARAAVAARRPPSQKDLFEGKRAARAAVAARRPPKSKRPFRRQSSGKSSGGCASTPKSKDLLVDELAICLK
jgi:hypothetical protein